MSRRAPLALALVSAIGGVGLGTGSVSADPDPSEAATAAADEAGSDDADLGQDDRGERRFDYSRFSDGPRRVPAPRGASKARADALGLGTRECASRLLHQPVPEAWRAAARGRVPERLLWPVDEGLWVRGYGYVRTSRPDRIHRGIDIYAPIGSVVRAAADGIVAYSDNGLRGYGNAVLIVHPNGWMTLYAHNSRTTVQPGYRVRRGERIALSGQTGIARGPHVHFELWEDGRARDPAALFDGGPRFVQQIAARAAARGAVVPPGEITAEDRVVEPPLAPHPEDRPSPERARESSEARRSARPLASEREMACDPCETRPSGESHQPELDRVSSIADHPIGSLALARHLLTHAIDPEILVRLEGRLFSTLLFPVRDGTVARAHRSARAPMQIAGAIEAPVRAAADGLVAFAGEIPGRGPTILLVHRSGWVTLYARLGSIAVRAGDHVERGAWIGRASERPIELELRIGGIARDPAPLLLAPARPSE